MPEAATIRVRQMNGEHLDDVALPLSSTVADLVVAIQASGAAPAQFKLLYEGRVLSGSVPLSDVGISDGAVVELIRGGLAGWTRICHGDQVGKEFSGAALIWDLTMHEVMELAKRATRVRIQAKADPNKAVTSKPDTYPIENLRAGNPIGYGRSLRKGEVDRYWESSDLTLVPDKLWHTNLHWHRKDHDKLEGKIYHCCDNGNGIHWDSGGCGWTCGGGEDLELYIDAE